VSGLALVHINDQTSTDEVIAPFGGVGLSGNGYRIGGQEANLEAFTEIAAVAYGDSGDYRLGQCTRTQSLKVLTRDLTNACPRWLDPVSGGSSCSNASERAGSRSGGDCGRDHDEDDGHRERDQPPNPIDTGTAISAERCVDEPADQNPGDSADDGQPNRDVVPVSRSHELAQQADNDTGHDDTDDLHCFLLACDG
jgi:hypothetical protein